MKILRHFIFLIDNLLFIFSAELLHYLRFTELLTLSANYLIGLVSLTREKDYIALTRILESVKYCLASVWNCNIRTAVR